MSGSKKEPEQTNQPVNPNPKKRGRKPKTNPQDDPIPQQVAAELQLAESAGAAQVFTDDLLGDSDQLSTVIHQLGVPATTELHKLTRFSRTKVTRINRSEARNAPYNPREISPSARINLRKSIQQHGLVDLPIWNRRTGNLVGGHQRTDRLDELEGSQNYSLEVNEIDVDERTEKALNIALNNPNLQGQYRADLLIDMFRKDEFDLDLSGFRPLDMEMLALDAGYATDLIDSMFSPAASATLDAITSDINSVIDQSDELKRRKAEDAKRNGTNGSIPPGSVAVDNQSGSSGAARTRKQSQDEDEGDDSDIEHDDSRYPEAVDSSRSESDQSHTHTANGTPKKLTPEQLAILQKAANSRQSATTSNSADKSPEYYREAKTKLSEAMLAQRDNDLFVTLCFISSEHKRAFCNAVGIGEQETLMDGPTMAEMAGIKLPELPKPKEKKAKDSESDSDNITIPFADANAT